MKLSDDVTHQGKFSNISASSHPDFLYELLDPLCRGLLRSIKGPDTHRGTKSIANEEALPTRVTESMYPLAILFSRTHEPELLAAVKNLGKLLITRQKKAGYWIDNLETTELILGYDLHRLET